MILCFAVLLGGERNLKNKENINMCDDGKISEKMKNMSKDEKKQHWENMIDCCSDMSDKEKEKMMKHMKECGGPTMGMMGHMMGRRHGKGHKGFMPMDMCGEMISSIRQSHRIATMATPEVQALFEDWVEQIDQEMLDYLKDKDPVDIKDLADHFKISKDSAYYFLTKLAQKGRIKLNVKTGDS
jgi:predicted transcriptional regulator